MKKIFLICVALLSFSSVCLASGDLQTREAIEKMFVLTDMDNTIEHIYDRLEGDFRHAVEQMDVPPGKLPDVERHFTRYSKQIRRQLDKGEIKAEIVDAYARTFTRQEIQELVKFYQSPVGRKLIAKMPELTDVSKSIINQHLQSLMPKIKQLQHNMAVEFAQLD